MTFWEKERKGTEHSKEKKNVVPFFQGSDSLEPSRWTHWDMQSGYHQPAGSYGHVHNLQTHPEKPIRAAAPGLHQGLTVMMDVKEDEYFCTGTESVGFKVPNSACSA